MKKAFLTGMGFLFLIPCLFASPQLEATISPEQITPDQTVVFKIQIKWPKSEAQYSFAFPEVSLKKLSVIRQGESQETFVKDGSEWIQKVFTLELQPSGEGTGIIESFSLPYMDPVMQMGGRLSLSEFTVKIKKTGRFTPLFILLGILLALIPAGIMAAIRLRRPKTPGPVVIPKNQAAMNSLKSLFSSTPDRKELIFKASSEFRRFIADYFGIASTQMTEDEMTLALAKKGLNAEELANLKALLIQLRDYKFLGDQVSESDLRTLEKDLSRYLESKRIVQNI